MYVLHVQVYKWCVWYTHTETGWCAVMHTKEYTTCAVSEVRMHMWTGYQRYVGVYHYHPCGGTPVVLLHTRARPTVVDVDAPVIPCMTSYTEMQRCIACGVLWYDMV